MRKFVSISTKIIVWVSFCLYLLALYYLLFVAYGRENWGEISRIDYAMKNIKLVPFETIGAYLSAIEKHGIKNSSIPVTNLLGNFILLMPLGVYLPLFISRLKKWKSYTAIIVSFVFGIEITQFLLMRGIFDIDDFMLNFGGAMVGFWIWKLSLMKWLENAYRGTWSKAQKEGESTNDLYN